MHSPIDDGLNISIQSKFPHSNMQLCRFNACWQIMSIVHRHCPKCPGPWWTIIANMKIYHDHGSQWKTLPKKLTINKIGDCLNMKNEVG
jgi:hypothetical protein